MSEDAPVNTCAPGLIWPDVESAQDRVLKIQTKLHQWAASDPHRRSELDGALQHAR